MYKLFKLHGNTMRFAPFRSKGEDRATNKVVKLECIKQIHFEYEESTKREYVNVTLNFAEDGSVILPNEDIEIASTITEKYRKLNTASNWDDGTIEFNMENTHRYKELPKEIKTITRTNNEPLWDVLMKISRSDITCDVIGNLKITFLNENNDVLGLQSIQRNIIDVPASVVRTKIEEIQDDVYSDIDLFFGVNDITNNEECYVKDEDVGTNSERVNILWPIVR